jgi:cell division protein FtsW (lipid II flippase)
LHLYSNYHIVIELYGHIISKEGSMNDQKEQEARQYVQSLKGFYQHLMSYIVINIVLIIINLVVDPHNLWFYWVLIFWGIGVLFQAVRTFGPGRKFDKSWEDKKVKEYLAKQEKEDSEQK